MNYLTLRLKFNLKKKSYLEMTITTELSTYELADQETEMIIDCKIPRYNVKLLNFDYILQHTFQKYNTDINSYNIRNDFKYKDTQKIFINALIVTLCNKIKVMPSSETIAIYVNRNTLMIPQEENDVLIKLILKTLRKLPFQFINNNTTVDFFLDEIHNNVVSTVIELETQLYYSKNFDVTRFSFKSLFKFLKSYDLVYLYDVYFKQSSNKLLVVR